MTSLFRIALASVATCAVLLPATGSAATAERKDGYLTDTQGGVVRAIGAGVCVRTSQWTPALAVLECDPDLDSETRSEARTEAEPKPEPKPEAKPKRSRSPRRSPRS